MDHSSDRRILIVEDDSTDFRLLREALRESVPERSVVKHASRLHQARDMVERETFDIMLLDISLVDVNGLDDVAHIVEQFSGIPLIVLGNQMDEEFGMRAVRAGAQDYLVKRFVDADILERAITHAIARHQHQYQTYSLERRFQAFLDGSKELHAIADASGILTYTSFELERPSGYTYGETARQSWFSLLHRDDQPRAREMWAELLAHPNVSRELQVRFGQVGHAWRVHNVTLTNALKQPAVAGVIIQSQDVTQEVDQQRMLSGLADITRALAAGGGLDSKLEAAFEVIARVLPVEEIRLLEYQDDLLDDTPVVAQRFAWRRAADGVASGEVSLAGGSVDPRIAARVNELATSEPGDAGVDIATQIFQNHVNAPDNPVLLLPYSLDDHVSGAAVVKARDGHRWSDEETTTLDAAINVIGSAISRRDAKTLSVNSDSRLEDVLSVVRDGVVVFDQSGLVRYANPALQDITGLRPGDFLKSNRVLLSTSSVRNFEQVIERSDGRQATITIDVARFPDGSGGVSGGVAYVRENTIIQRAVQLLHGNEARLRAIVATAFEAIITTDDAGVVESFNPAAEAMFGFAADEIIGQEISRLIPEPLLSSNDDALNPLLDPALIRSGGHVREMKAVRADGSAFPIELSAREYVHRNQRKYIGSIRDISQRRAAENRIAYQIHQLESLRRVDRVLGSSRDLDVILDVVLDQLVLQPDIDAAVFRLFNDVTQTLDLRGARGFDSDAALPLAVHLGEGLAGCAALERKRADLRELSDEGASTLIVSVASDCSPIAGIATPLVANGQLKGTLEIYRFRAAAVATGSINFVGGLASQTAVAIDNTELFVKIERSNHQLERAYEATLEGWSQALEMRGVDTAGHSQRVSDLAVLLGRSMGIDGENLKALRRGALLHDIGKIGVSDAVLHKPGNLDEADWAVIQQVPNHAHRLLSSIPFLRAATEIPFCHHEKWDGSGYPRGLQEETIPFAARVFAVVDVWDTLISDRPYRAALTRSEALGYIASQAGKHFDPDVVSAFLEMMATENSALELGEIRGDADLLEDAATGE